MITHKFEEAGLGKAPFRLLGMFEKRCTGQPNAQGLIVGSPGQPAGTCDYCGTGIANCYEIQSADGHKFVVGENCVEKTYDKGLVDTVKRSANKLKNEARHVREKARIEAAAPIIHAVIERERSNPHPISWRAERGETMGDNISWLWNNCGNAGKLKLIREWCGRTLHIPLGATRSPGRKFNRAIAHVHYAIDNAGGDELRFIPNSALNWFHRNDAARAWKPLIYRFEVADIMARGPVAAKIELRPGYEETIIQGKTWS